MPKKTIIDKRIGQRIRRLRDYQGYSQDYVADEIGMSSGNLGKIERAEIDPNTSSLYKIARVLKVNVVEFFSDNQIVAEPKENIGTISREEFLKSNQDIITAFKTEIEKLREEFSLKNNSYQLKNKTRKSPKNK